MREVMKNPPSEEIIKYIFGPMLVADKEKYFAFNNYINKAHLMMLKRQGIVSEETAKFLYKAIRKLEAEGVDALDLDPNKEDMSSCIEAYLTKECGAAVAGQLHTGRSRNDMGGTATRMSFRKAALAMMDQIDQLRDCMLQFARNNIDAVCSGYTCAQPAEPVTIAYWFCAFLGALDRDRARLSDCWQRLNLSPLGACAMAGTTFDISREQTAMDMGFIDPVMNCLDAIAARDYILELFADLSIFSVNLSRFCQDLYSYATYEYGFLDVDSSMCMCSSIMPQKKNPVTFEHIKARAAHLQAAFISASSAIKNTPYTQVRDSSVEAAHALTDAVEMVESCVQLLIKTINTMEFNTEKMLAETKINFSTVSELANCLVRSCGISFRQAHSIVGKVVRILLDEDKVPTDITVEMVNTCAEAVLGEDLNITEDVILQALDPVRNVAARTHTGAPSRAAVSAQLDILQAHLTADKTSNANRKAALKAAADQLEKDIDALIG